MELTNPITELIRARSSRRRYQPRPIDPEPRDKLEAAIEELSVGLFGSEMRFRLVAATEGDRSALKGLGTYGFIKDAPGFVVGAVRSGPRDMEDYGYAMERIILAATDLMLGTCWLGGTFSRSGFAKKIDLGRGEVVPAVISIGHATERRGSLEKVIRWGAGSKKRLPWEKLFFSGELGVPLSPESAGDFAEPLEMVRLAPSASNKQPWRIVKARGEATFHLYVERTPGYAKSSGPLQMADLQRIDMGIAMSHFEQTAREAGLSGAWGEAEPDHGALPQGTESIATWR